MLAAAVVLDRTTPAELAQVVPYDSLLGPLTNLRLDGVGWAIVGGESGPGARPMSSDWATDIRDRCQTAGVPFFFKQWGGRTPKANGRQLDGQLWPRCPAGRWWPGFRCPRA